jgi:hypothetical protein
MLYNKFVALCAHCHKLHWNSRPFTNDPEPKIWIFCSLLNLVETYCSAQITIMSQNLQQSISALAASAAADQTGARHRFPVGPGRFS